MIDGVVVAPGMVFAVTGELPVSDQSVVAARWTDNQKRRTDYGNKS